MFGWCEIGSGLVSVQMTSITSIYCLFMSFFQRAAKFSLSNMACPRKDALFPQRIAAIDVHQFPTFLNIGSSFSPSSAICPSSLFSMKFAILLAFTSVLGLSVTASSMLPTACGPNANILNESSFTHNGADVKLATISCPGSDIRGRGSLVNASKRQVVSQCDAVAHPCIAIECDLRPEQPSLLDCNDLTIALDGLSDPLLIPARTGMTITLATCTYVYVNLDTVEYSVCGSDIGTLGTDTTTDCSTTATNSIGGLCFSPQVPGDNWFFEPMTMTVSNGGTTDLYLEPAVAGISNLKAGDVMQILKDEATYTVNDIGGSVATFGWDEGGISVQGGNRLPVAQLLTFTISLYINNQPVKIGWEPTSTGGDSPQTVTIEYGGDVQLDVDPPVAGVSTLAQGETINILSGPSTSTTFFSCLGVVIATVQLTGRQATITPGSVVKGTMPLVVSMALV
ncbi:hypothetical protein B0H13DRAFT_2335211 [Mycena leptocephala]|nr:hypothetical protein B0H13DRAFT_2335211 [Mycena leptocephala]